MKRKILSSFLVITFAAWQIAPFSIAENAPELLGVDHGSVTSSTVGNTTNAFASDRSISNWNFDIPQAHTFNLTQPSSNAVALFRDVTGDPSLIHGALNANGRLFLLNPNGVLFGQNASVNVGALIASSLDMSNSDFLAGNYAFRQFVNSNPGYILNQGLIRSSDKGFVTLLGGAVSNEGAIVAPAGSVNLVSASSAIMAVDNQGLVNIAVGDRVVSQARDLEGNPVKSVVTNSGKVSATGGVVQLTAHAVESAFDSVINHSGVIEADSVETRNGVIVLNGGDSGWVQVTGDLRASGNDTGEKGGLIKVLGEKVAVVGNARLDASGDQGGGKIHVGGEYQGSGSQNATRTVVGQDASLNANADWEGDGGEIVVWSDDTTQYYGSISSKGGLASGNGGLVEVSGKERLAFNGSVDATAKNGNAGSLLLDPATINLIDAVAATGGLDGDIADDTLLAADPDGVDNNLSWGTIDTLLNSANVLIEASGLITVEDVTGAAGAGISSNNLVELDLTTGSLTVRSTTGSIVFNDVMDVIRTEGGAITFEALGGDLTAGGFNTTGAGGAQSGNVTLTSTNNISFQNISAGNGVVNVFGDSDANSIGATVDAGTVTAGDVLIQAGADLNDFINLNGAIQSSAAIIVDSAATVDLSWDATAATDLTISNVGLINVGDDLNLTALNGSIDLQTGVGAIALIGAAGTANIFEADGDGSVLLAGITSTNGTDLTINSEGEILSSGISGVSALVLNIDNGGVNTATNSNFGALSAGSIAISASGNDTLTFSGATTSTATGIQIGNAATVNVNADITSTTSLQITNVNVVDLGTNADLTANNGLLDVSTNVGSINLSGAAGTTNVIEGNGDALVTLANITDSSPDQLTVNSEGSVTMQNVDIDGDLMVNVDTDDDGTETGNFGTIAANSVNIQGASGASARERLNLQSTVTTLGNQIYAGNLYLNDNLTTTSSGSITQTGPTILVDDVTVMTAGGQNILFNGTIDGTNNELEDLTLNAGAGSVTLTGMVGNNVRLGDVVIIGTGNAFGDIDAKSLSITGDSLMGGNYDFTGAWSITGNITLTADTVISSGGLTTDHDLFIDGTIEGTAAGTESLKLISGAGDIAVTGAIGSTMALEFFEAQGNTLAVNSVRTSGYQVYGGQTTLNGAAYTSLAGTPGRIEFFDNVNLGTNVTLSTGGAAGDDIIFRERLNADAAANNRTIDLNAGALGDVRFLNDIGVDQAVQSLTVTTAEHALFQKIITRDGGISITTTGSTTTLNDDLDTTAGANAGNITIVGSAKLGDDINFLTDHATGTDGNILMNGPLNATISGGQGLNVFGGNGTAAFTNAVGSTQRLEYLSVHGSTISLQAVNTTGAQTYSGATTLNGNLNSNAVGGAITVSGNTTLANDISVSTAGLTANDDISFTGTINGTVAGTESLTLNAGAADVNLGGNVGGTVPLEFLSATANTIDVKAVTTANAQTYNGKTTLRGDLLSTASGDITVNGDAIIGADVQIDTAKAAGDDILFTGTINDLTDGTNSLNLDAGLGNVTIQNNVGGNTTKLEGLTVNGANISLKEVFTALSQSYIGTVITLAGNLSALASGGSLTFTGPVTLTSSINVTTLDGNVTFTDTVNAAAAGVQSLTVHSTSGDANFLGDIGLVGRLNSLTVTANDINLQNVETANAQTYNGSGNTTTLNGNLTSTTGGDITINDNTVLANDVIVTTAGGANDDIFFNGTVNGAFALTSNAGAGDVTYLENIGDATPLTSLTTIGNHIYTKKITTSGFQTYTGDTFLDNNLTSTASGDITFNGDVVIGHDLTIAVSGNAGDDILFNGNLDGVSNGSEVLALNAGANGDIAFQGQIGSFKELEGVLITNANDTLFNDTVEMGYIHQLNGTGTTTFNDQADLSQDVNVKTGAVLFSGAGEIISNSGNGAVILNAQTGSITSTSTALQDISSSTLVAQAATGIGVSGTPLDTKINRLEAQTATGGIFVKNTGALTLGGITGAANAVVASGVGNIEIATASPMTVQNNVIQNANSLLLLTAQGNLATDTITILSGANVVAQGGGDINTISGGNTTVQAGAAIRNTAGGNIVMAAGENSAAGGINDLLGGAGDGLSSAELNLVEGSEVSATSGNGTLLARGNVKVASLDLNSDNDASIGNATLYSENSSILDNTNAENINVRANNVTIDGRTGIGQGAIGTVGGLNTEVATINASVSGTGIINIDELDQVTLTDIDTANGTINVQSGGTMTVTDVDANSTGAVNNVNLTSTAGAILGTANDATRDIEGATINLVAGAGGIGTDANGAIDVTATTALNADSTADNANIFLDSIGNLPIGLVNSGTGNTTLNSTGNMTDASTDAAADVVGSTVNLTTTGGIIGTSDVNSLDVTANTEFNANSNGGNIFVDSVGNLPVGLVTAGAGNVDLDSSGDINNANAVDGVADIVGSIITLDADVNGIGMGANGAVEVAAATELNANTTTNDANTDGSGISLISIGDLPVGLITAGTGASGAQTVGSRNVTVVSTRSIVQSIDDASADIIGNTVDLTANTTGGAAGIGNSDANSLDVTANTLLNATTSGSNNSIFVDSLGNLPVGFINAGTGEANIDSTGNITDGNADAGVDVNGGIVDLTATGGDIGTSDGNALDITASDRFNANTTAGNNNIFIDSLADLRIGLVNAGSGNVDLDSTGNMTDRDADAAADVIGSTISLTTTGGAIGTNDADSLDITALASANADTTATNSNIFLDSIGNLPVGLITAGSGNVDLDSDAAIDSVSDNGVADVVGSVIDLTATVGGIGNNSVLDVTAATLLNADTVTGDDSNINLDSIGNLPAGQINAGTGSVTLDSTGNINNGTAVNGIANVIGGTLNLIAAAGGIGTTANGPLEITGTVQVNANTTADNGNINLNSIGNLPVGLIDAGANGGDIAINSTGNVADANDAGAAQNLNLRGDVGLLNATTGIGTPANPIEVQFNAVTPTTLGGGAFLNTSGGNTIIQNALVTGQFNVNSTGGDLYLENNVVSGSSIIQSTGNILSFDSEVDDLTASDIWLLAGGTIGTPALSMNLVVNGGQLAIEAGRENNSVSSHIHSNVSRKDVQFINVPPGLVIFNGHALGGNNITSLEKSMSIQYVASQEMFWSYGQYGVDGDEVIPQLTLRDNASYQRSLELRIQEPGIYIDFEIPESAQLGYTNPAAGLTTLSKSTDDKKEQLA